MIISKLQQVWNHFLQDNLFRNSIYLMLSTGLMGALGFFFWMLCTRLFSPDQIGIGTALISAMSMISFISLLGWNATFIRFLPTSKNRDNEINTGLILVTFVTITVAAVYISLISYFTPNLVLIRENAYYSLIFIFLSVAISLNSLADSIFIAYRSAQYSLIANGIVTSISKFILVSLLTALGAYGIFTASGIATFIGLSGSFLFLILKFKYRPRFYIDGKLIRKVFHYSFANYLANLFAITPTLLLPLIIIGYLGAAASGYYYLAFMVINLLYTVSGSISQSLFAEGSYGESILRVLLKRSIKILILILAPAAILLAIFGPLILHFFGKSYIAGGGQVITVLALGSPFVAAFNIGTTLLKIRRQMSSLIFINILYASSVCLLTLLWIERGLTWVAFAWNIGNLIAAIACFLAIYIYRKNPTPIIRIEE